MSKQIITPKGSAPPLAPYSPGTKAGNTVYVSGMLALDANGQVVGPGDIKTQTRVALDSIKEVIEEAGGSMADITMNSIILKTMADYKGMNEVYATYFPEAPPARYCIQADLVRPEFLVEIVAIAHIEH